MQPQLQGVEVEAVRRRDHDLAVDDTFCRQPLMQRVAQLGKVAIERAQIAALDEDTGTAAKDDGAEAVPLRVRTRRRRHPAAPRSAWRASVRRAAESEMRRRRRRPEAAATWQTARAGGAVASAMVCTHGEFVSCSVHAAVFGNPHGGNRKWLS
jgi:hypothetical protein